MKIRTCVSPEGYFEYGIHRPSYLVRNQRRNDYRMSLGRFPDGTEYVNDDNFPEAEVVVSEADRIYEIPNPFPFRGTTYIAQRWACRKADQPSLIGLPQPAPVSFSSFLEKQPGSSALQTDQLPTLLAELPAPLLFAIAETSTDPRDLVGIAKYCCDFIYHEDGKQPAGLRYQTDPAGRCRAVIHHHDLFEVLVNNIHLPDEYKVAMVLKPGVQGDSEIVGEWEPDRSGTHVFEYLRQNSYIPWGHYASNMAHDAVRYRIADLSMNDIKGLRHLYYQRNYIRLAEECGVALPRQRETVSEGRLEEIREAILQELSDPGPCKSIRFSASLWGWNYGFDFAPSGYRLHASHQQIHQQYSMIPAGVETEKSRGDGRTSTSSDFLPFSCGDLIDECISDYRQQTGHSFFNDYEKAIRTNRRMDERTDLPSSLIVHEDDQVMLFVPKAQTSQWELQLMPRRAIGNIVEADRMMRASLDQAIWTAMQVLTAMGARMITTIEFSKRFDRLESDQRLLYSFLPKLPESPGAFSEAQLRWINGHYPEDFARACRARLPKGKNEAGMI